MDRFFIETIDYLMHQSWQIAAVFVLVAAGCWGLRRASAHWRYLLWLIVLGKCLVPPIMNVPVAVLPDQPVPVLEQATISTPSAPVITEHTAAAENLLEPIEPTPAVLAAPQPTKNRWLPQLTFVQWLAVGYLAGASLFFVVTLTKAWQVNRTLRESRRPAAGQLQDQIAAVARQIAPRRMPTVWLVDRIAQPFVWGLFRGDIYLPADFGRSVSAEKLRGILMHELAHVLRFDAAVNALQVVAQGVFFFHPLVWWTNRKIRQEREKCCDEAAIAQLGLPARQYGSAIVDTLVAEYESSRPVPSLAIAGPVRNIEERIKTIMKANKRFQKRPSWTAIVTVSLLAMVTIPTALTLTARAEEKTTAATTQSGKKTDVQIEVEKAAQRESDAVESARAWLAVVDGGDYAKSWQQAAGFFRKAVSKDKWQGQLHAFRLPLGKVLSRTVKSRRHVTSLPGAPDGEYIVVQFETSFENKKSAIETVTPMKDKDGKWRVSGYYIK